MCMSPNLALIYAQNKNLEKIRSKLIISKSVMKAKHIRDYNMYYRDNNNKVCVITDFQSKLKKYFILVDTGDE